MERKRCLRFCFFFVFFKFHVILDRNLCENESCLLCIVCCVVGCFSVTLQIRANVGWHGKVIPGFKTRAGGEYVLLGRCSFQIFIKMSLQPINNSWLQRCVRAFRPSQALVFFSPSVWHQPLTRGGRSAQEPHFKCRYKWIYPNICISDWLYLWAVGIKICVRVWVESY